MKTNSPIDSLTEKDILQIQKILKWNCQIIISTQEIKENVLAEWNRSKSYLYKLFGGNLRKSIVVKTKYSINDHIDRLSSVYNNPMVYLNIIDGDPANMYRAFKEMDANICSLFNNAANYIIDSADFSNKEKSSYLYILVNLFSYELVASNRIGDFSNDHIFKLVMQHNIDSNAKTIKMIHRFFNKIGFDDGFCLKEWVDAVSTCSTEKRTEDVEIVLSINPVDILLVSDNNSNWSTCFSLANKGEYSEHISELLNSPNAIIAYINNRNDKYIIDGEVLPNMSWRSLELVGTQGIMSGKGYPYSNYSVQEGIVEALESISKQVYGLTIAEKRWCTSENNLFEVTSKKLYNDWKFSDLNIMFINCVFDNSLVKTFSLSGKDTCLCCGKQYDCNRHECKNGISLFCSYCFTSYFCECEGLLSTIGEKRYSVMVIDPNTGALNNANICRTCLIQDFYLIERLGAYVNKDVYDNCPNTLVFTKKDKNASIDKSKLEQLSDMIYFYRSDDFANKDYVCDLAKSIGLEPIFVKSLFMRYEKNSGLYLFSIIDNELSSFGHGVSNERFIIDDIEKFNKLYEWFCSPIDWRSDFAKGKDNFFRYTF